MTKTFSDKGKIILFEGYDGAGKTTLINLFREYLSSNGFTSLAIYNTDNKFTANIDFVIKDSVFSITPTTEILLRLAREFERMKILRENKEKYDFIILDRGILSLISWIQYHEQTFSDYKVFIDKILEEMESFLIIDCYLEFNKSWNRVISRGNLTKKESMGKEINNRIFLSQREIFSNFQWPGITKHMINMENKECDCLRKLLTALSL